MDSVLRAAIIYFFLLFIFNIAGKRAMSETDTFDFVVLLIISEATQQAMLGDDLSLTNSISVILTLIGLSIVMSVWKYRSNKLETVMTGGPIILVQDGKPIRERMKMARVDEADILQAARDTQALERMEQIKYAVLEHSGSISIIPKEGEGG
jgi:uncharacterized membrane protein YcaP (DUF421 family)